MTGYGSGPSSPAREWRPFEAKNGRIGAQLSLHREKMRLLSVLIPLRLRFGAENILQLNRIDEIAVSAVRIYQPAKTAMQSGRGKTRHWVVEFEPTAPRDTDPLMGWTSSSDTRSQLRLRFESREQAVAYAESKGLSYTVRQPHVRRIKPKNYADNFSSRWVAS